MKDKKVYKIRNKKTGKYSTGGARPTFSSQGRTWSSIGYLKKHYRLVRKENKNINVYANCEIVVFEEIGTMDLVDLLTKDEMIKEILD